MCLLPGHYFRYTTTVITKISCVFGQTLHHHEVQQKQHHRQNPTTAAPWFWQVFPVKTHQFSTVKISDEKKKEKKRGRRNRRTATCFPISNGPICLCNDYPTFYRQLCCFSAWPITKQTELVSIVLPQEYSCSCTWIFHADEWTQGTRCMSVWWHLWHLERCETSLVWL